MGRPLTPLGPRATRAFLVFLLALLGAVPVVTGGPTTASAQTPAKTTVPSYRVSEDSWSGIGYLIQTAEEAKVDLTRVGTLDLTTLRPGDVVVWLYPTADLPVADLAKFVEDGGFLVVADDHGSAKELFQHFGIVRSSAGPSHHRNYHHGQAGLPRLVPDRNRSHFLYFNVNHIVANHPATLSGAGDAIFSFDTPEGAPAEHLVMESARGRGRFMAIADPSLFINDMIGRAELHGNKQFAANVLRRNCTRDCRVLLALPTTTTTGSYRARGGPLGELPRVFDEAAALLNENLADVSESLSVAPWSWILVACLAILAMVVLSRALGHLPARLAGNTLGRDSGLLQSPLVHQAIGMSATRHDADFGHLADTLLTHVHGLEAAGLVPAVPESGNNSGTDLQHMAGRALLRIQGEAARFRRSADAPTMSSERFLRLYDDVRLVSSYAASTGRRRKGSSMLRQRGNSRG